MPGNLRHPTRALFLLAVLAAGGAYAQNPAAAPRGTPVVLDVLALDRDGRFVEDLRPADFVVTVDGTSRPVLWVHRVSRGTGAMSDALTRRAAAGDEVAFGAEAERNVFVLIDEASIARGEERAVVQAAGLFLDRLALDDRVAVVRLPLASDVSVAVTAERAETRVALSQVAGRRAIATDGLAAAPPAPVSAEPDRMTGLDPDRPVGVDAAAEAVPPDRQQQCQFASCDLRHAALAARPQSRCPVFRGPAVRVGQVHGRRRSRRSRRARDGLCVRTPGRARRSRQPRHRAARAACRCHGRGILSSRQNP